MRATSKPQLELLAFTALVILAALLSNGCAVGDEITFELPDRADASSADGEVLTPLIGAPLLRSPFASSERVTSQVSHSSGGRLVDYACRRISRRGHRGTDFGVPVGTPVHAAAAGRVIRRADGCGVGSRGCGGGFGNHVILLHEGNRATLYGHLKSGSGIPALGANVECGQRIGASGNTGRSTGPHLHFEVRDGVANADLYFSRPAVDPYAGACSSQPTALFMDGTPGPTCDGAAATPRDDSGFEAATHRRAVRARPGEEVVQRWTLRNTGSTIWTQSDGYALRPVGGEDLGHPDPIPLPVSSVPPGGRATFELRASAPATGGTHRGEWRMARGTAGLFGATVSLAIEVVAPPAPRACRSRTLGRDVPDGECVQVGYPACGSSECAWFACQDGAWQCTPLDACATERHAFASCPAAPSCETRVGCGECATEPGCAFCPDDGRCVPETDRACGGAITDAAECETCHEEGAVCAGDEDCCGSGDAGTMRCLLGFCADVSGCGQVGAGCSTRTDCCGMIVCEPGPGGDRACCLRDSDRCDHDGDCCGEMQCNGGRCACRGSGESCASIADCCGGMLCNAGVCGF